MVDQNKNDEIKTPEKPLVKQEQAVAFKHEVKKNLETKEDLEDRVAIAAELRREIEKMELDPALAHEVEVQKENISYLDEQKKIEHLLKIAREKGGEVGLVLAVHAARDTNDPFILDLLHDTLIKEGLYDELINKRK